MHPDHKTDKCSNQICDCINWTPMENVIIANHLLKNYNPESVYLEYPTSTIGTDQAGTYCLIGKCNACGKQICTGTPINNIQNLGHFFEQVYKQAYYDMWIIESSTTHIQRQSMFIQLFNECDRQDAIEWLYELESR